MADNVAIIVFSPTSSRETLGGMFSDCLLLHFLYPKMFFMPLQTRSDSSAAVCCQSSSCNSVFALPDLPPLLLLYPPQLLFVPDIKDLFLSFSRGFSSGGTRDLLEKHCTTLMDTVSSKIMHDAVCQPVCNVLPLQPTRPNHFL